MLLFDWIVGILTGAVVLAALARRIGAPFPAFLALGGVGIAFLPGVPNLTLDPGLALALFLAPVLLDAGYDTSLRDLLRCWRPVAGLALGAVAATTLAVAVVAKVLVPDMPLAAAIVLGAIVAPPDAVAALSVLAPGTAQAMPLPHRLITILRGESLLNDASALLIYRLGVAAAVTGHVEPSEVAPTFLVGVLGSLVVGPLLALVSLRLIRWFDDAASTIVLQFVAAFGIWIAAEKLQLSGVLTVVSYAITVSRFSPGQTAPRARILSYAVWDTAIFVLNVLAFVLIGNQIGPILERLRDDHAVSHNLFAGLVVLTVILVRIAWVLPASGLRGIGFEAAAEAAPKPKGLGLGAGFAVSWAGMRGLVTVAAALALPEGFPHRDLLVFTAFCTVLGTLVLQGLTLRPLIARLRLEDTDPVGHEVGWGRAQAYQAALDRLKQDESQAAEALRREFALALKQAAAHEAGHAPEALPADEARRKAVSAARDRILALRREGRIGDDAYYVLEEEFDWAELDVTPRAER
ncbi:sodium:proton antiporter [Methylobacterium organophilum]|uniref:cation:proton antiporter n=1 Tax=Methylobacterium organophilum TaxID=410 RepID=UPI001F13009F|nr:sodium:proton antiporter [Methylobacterium organophilum]UMY18716.1 sodium:proton antiporter [Methylobacterium organophilum]